MGRHDLLAFADVVKVSLGIGFPGVEVIVSMVPHGMSFLNQALKNSRIAPYAIADAKKRGAGIVSLKLVKDPRRHVLRRSVVKSQVDGIMGRNVPDKGVKPAPDKPVSLDPIFHKTKSAP